LGAVAVLVVVVFFFIYQPSRRIRQTQFT